MSDPGASETSGFAERPSPDARQSLDSFRGGLRRELHVLAKEPSLLWQQLYNRLQWEDESVRTILAREEKRRSGRPAEGTAWLRMKTPFRESRALVRRLSGHSSYVGACAVSPTEPRLLASASGDGTIKLWDTSSGIELGALCGHRDTVADCAFAADGSRLVSASADGTLILWDVASREPLARLEGHTDWLWACDFSPDGTRIASASKDGTVRVWDAASGEVAGSHGGSAGGFGFCSFSPDGRLLATAPSSPGGVWLGDRPERPKAELLLLDGSTARVRHRIRAEGDEIRACAFSPDGKRIATAESDGAVRLWDVSTGTQQTELRGHEDAVTGCAFGPDGALLVSAGGFDLTARVWDLESGQEVAVLRGHTAWVKGCEFSPDGALIATSGGDGNVILWNVEALEGQDDLPGHPDQALCCTYSRDGSRVFSGGWEGNVVVWDGETGAEIGTMEGDGTPVYDCAPSADDGRIASVTGEGTLRIWNPATLSRLAETRLGTASLRCCAFGPGDVVAVGGHGGLLQLRHGESGELVAAVDAVDRLDSAHYFDCAWSPDGRYLAACGADGAIVVWDVEEVGTGAEVETLAGHRGSMLDLREGELHPSLAGMGDAVALLAQTSSRFGAPEDEFGGVVPMINESPGVYGCAFAADGTTTASAGSDGTVRLWNLGAGGEGAILGRHGGWGRCCAFSDDGRIVVSGGDDHALRFWDVAARGPLATFYTLGAVTDCRFHPSRHEVCCTDTGGNVYLLELRLPGAAREGTRAGSRRAGEQPTPRDRVHAVRASPPASRPPSDPRARISRDPTGGATMKDRFEAHEWELLTTLPFHFFGAVALADGEIEDREFEEFVRNIQERATDDRNPLHRDIAAELAGMTYGEFLEKGPEAFACDPQGVKRILEARLSADEYQSFIGSLFRDALNVATVGDEVPAGGPPLGTDATNVLIEMATFWEIDLPSLLGTILGG